MASNPRHLFASGHKAVRAAERLAAREDYRAGREPRWNASLVYLHEYDRQKRLHVGGFYTVPEPYPGMTLTETTRREDA